VLNIECEKCGRRGRYHLHRLIERCGIDAKLFDWSDEITADCPRKQAKNADSDDVARPNRDDAARGSEMMSPGVPG
jgi:hypothetical protein